MSVDVSVGPDLPSPQELGRGALGLEGPSTFVISWTIIAVLAYISSAGLVVTIFVALFATLMVGVGLIWLLGTRLRGGGG